MIVKSGWRDRLQARRWERQQGRQRDQEQPTVSTATTTRATTTPPAAAEAVRPVCLHSFRAGPFDQWTCRGAISVVRPGLRPGTLSFSVPFPLTPEAAIAWDQAILRWESNPIPSERGRWATYINGERPGEWVFVPYR